MIITGEVRVGSLAIALEIKADGELVKDWDVEGIMMKMTVSRK